MCDKKAIINGVEYDVNPDAMEEAVSSLNYARDKFIYYTEVEMATLGYFLCRNKPPKYEVERHEKIITDMIEVCKTLKVTERDCERMKAGRVKDVMFYGKAIQESC